MADIPLDPHRPVGGEIRRPSFTVEIGEAMYSEKGEDRTYSNPSDMLFAVADGMGGHGNGGAAANLAIDTLDRMFEDRPLTLSAHPAGDILDTQELLVRTVERAQSEVTHGPSGEWANLPPDRHPGSTLSAVAIVEHEDGPCAVMVGIGDTPIMLIRGDTIRTELKIDSAIQDVFVPRILEAAQIPFDTADISDIMEVLDGANTGHEAYERLRTRFTDEVSSDLVSTYFSMRNVITSGLGVGGDIHSGVDGLEDGDIIMIGSDGITDPLTPNYIHDIIAARDDLDEAAKALVDAARSVPSHARDAKVHEMKRGKKDDASVILLRIKINEAGEPEEVREPEIKAETEQPSRALVREPITDDLIDVDVIGYDGLFESMPAFVVRLPDGSTMKRVGMHLLDPTTGSPYGASEIERLIVNLPDMSEQTVDDDLERKMRAEIEWPRGEQTPEFWTQKTREVATVRKAFANSMATLINSGELSDADLDLPEDAISVRLGGDHEFVRLGTLLSDLVEYILTHNPSLRGVNPDRVHERIERQIIEDIAVDYPLLADRLEGPPSDEGTQNV